MKRSRTTSILFFCIITLQATHNNKPCDGTAPYNKGSLTFKLYPSHHIFEYKEENTTTKNIYVCSITKTLDTLQGIEETSKSSNKWVQKFGTSKTLTKEEAIQKYQEFYNFLALTHPLPLITEKLCDSAR